MTAVVLPGDAIAPDDLPTGTGKRKTLKIGPGLRHIPPSTVVTSIAGALVTDPKKNAASIDFNSGRYQPFPNDLVIATVQSSVAESFNCTLTPHTPFATLPHLAFEGATKKTRPQLPPNSLVYARIATCTRDSAPELTCVDPSTGKSEGLGLVKGGMVFKLSLGMARRLLAPRGGLLFLDVLGEKIGFEVTVGRNGVLHVDAGSVKKTIAIGRGVVRVDEEGMGEAGQKKLAGEILKMV